MYVLVMGIIYIYILAQTYQTTIVSTNTSVIKEWKLYSNINSEKHLFCNSPVGQA